MLTLAKPKLYCSCGQDITVLGKLLGDCIVQYYYYHNNSRHSDKIFLIDVINKLKRNTQYYLHLYSSTKNGMHKVYLNGIQINDINHGTRDINNPILVQLLDYAKNQTRGQI